MAIEITDSAGKHGFTHADALHAMTHAPYYVPNFDDSRIPGGIKPDLWIGPARSGLTIEVMGYRRPPRTLVVFHMMEVRPGTWALIEEEQE